jgi:hypothetical protein
MPSYLRDCKRRSRKVKLTTQRSPNRVALSTLGVTGTPGKEADMLTMQGVDNIQQ